MLNKIKKNPNLGRLLLRLGVGFVFLIHGAGKLFNIGPFASGVTAVAGNFANLGIPVSTLAAWIVAIVETLGGAFLILGIFVSLSALILAIEMAIALLVVHLRNGFYTTAGELPLVLFLGSLAILFLGAGKYALQKDKK